MCPYCVVYKTQSESLALGSSVQTVFSRRSRPQSKIQTRASTCRSCSSSSSMHESEALSVQLDHAYHSVVLKRLFPRWISSSLPARPLFPLHLRAQASTPAATYGSSLSSSYCCGSLLCTGRLLRAVKRRGGVFAPRYLVSLTSVNQRRRRRRDGVAGCSRASRQLGHADGRAKECEGAIKAIAEPELQ
jgi:hypothetical protein